MLLKRAELENICQHERLVLDFGPGVTGIFGPNGAGKTNCVNMIQASLTGDFGVNPGKKEDNIRHDAPEDAKSRVTTEWEHDDLPFKLVRSLRPSSQKLFLGEQKITRANAIAEELTKLLGVDRRVIDDYVFVRQWSVFDFISADPATRQKSFMRLCNVDKAEQIWTLLGQQIRKDEALAASIVDNRKELKARIEAANERVEAKTVELEAWRKLLLTEEEEEAANSLIEDFSRKGLLKKQYKQAKQALEDAQTTAEDRRAELEKVEGNLTGLIEAEEKAAETFRELSARYDEAEKQERLRSRRKGYEDILLRDPPEAPEEPDSYIKASELRALIDAKTARLSELDKQLSVFEAEGVVECPTCGTSVEDLADCLAERVDEAEKLQEEVEQLREQRQQIEQYETVLQRYQLRLADFERKRDQAQAALAEIPEAVDVEPVSQEELARAQRAATKAKGAVSSLRAVQQQASSSLAKAEGQLETLAKRIEQYDQELEQLDDVTAYDSEAAKNMLKAHREATLEVRGCEAILSEVRSRIAEDKQEIRKITEVIKRSKKAQTWLQDLESWREVFHREALPRIVTQTMMENLVEQINQTLELFNGPFRVSAEDRLTFLAHKPRGYAETAARLSGGEKAVLGIAFRFSIARQVGMMVLDEPTAGLDSDNIDCFIDMLDRISEYTRQRGQQVIIITHDRRLERVLDRKIELSRV